MAVLLQPQIQDVGLFLDIIGLVLIAKFHIPSEVLSASGTDMLEINPSPEVEAQRISRYKKAKSITKVAYFITAVGFLLQSNTVAQYLGTT